MEQVRAVVARDSARWVDFRRELHRKTARRWNGFPHAPDYVADERSINVDARKIAAVIVERLRVR